MWPLNQIMYSFTLNHSKLFSIKFWKKINCTPASMHVTKNAFVLSTSNIQLNQWKIIFDIFDLYFNWIFVVDNTCIWKPFRILYTRIQYYTWMPSNLSAFILYIFRPTCSRFTWFFVLEYNTQWLKPGTFL